ncbi:hypothetical protein AHiyo6_16720 [Arthrobacter sp. Hiyo6]|nr:hypothetical protein AHiyo6_16720 [Arthrobacter sp. Hiyo6]
MTTPSSPASSICGIDKEPDRIIAELHSGATY